LVSLRAARSSRLVSGAAIVALIVVASLSVSVIDSHPLANPLQRDFIRPADAPLPKTGILSVRMFSNQNFTSIVSEPLETSMQVPNFPMQVITVNSSVISEVPQSLSTDSNGVARLSLLPGVYVLRVTYNTLRIEIPVRILGGNTTSVGLNVSEGAYPLLYSEAADVGGQPSLYTELSSSTRVANVTEPVTLQVKNGETGNGYEIYATVVSEQPPSQGTQWLELGSLGAFDLAGAATVLLATWTYSTSITVGPTVQAGPLGA